MATDTKYNKYWMICQHCNNFHVDCTCTCGDFDEETKVDIGNICQYCGINCEKCGFWDEDSA